MARNARCIKSGTVSLVSYAKVATFAPRIVCIVTTADPPVRRHAARSCASCGAIALAAAEGSARTCAASNATRSSSPPRA